MGVENSRFARRLALIVAAALGIRLLYVLAVVGGETVTGDGAVYHQIANLLAERGHYVAPGYLDGPISTNADKPPLFTAYLALPSLLGWTSVEAHRLASTLLGALTVALVGLLGRRVAGERAGLLAAALAAVYPMLVMLDGSLRSESLYAPLLALILLASYRLLDGPGPGRAALLGGLIGLATLTRSEALLLLPLLALPLVRLAPRGTRLRLAGIVTAGALLVVTPWVVRNWAHFDRPLLSTNDGTLLYGANCDAAYKRPLLGSWPCFPRVRFPPGTSQAEISTGLRRRGLEYARDHAGRLPLVMTVRVLRVWDLYEPRAQARLETFISDRDLRWQQAGTLMLYLLAPLAVFGGLALRSRGQPLRILIAPLLLVTLLAALAYGTSRFRVPAEIPLVVLAAAGIVELAERRSRARAARSGAAANTT